MRIVKLCVMFSICLLAIFIGIRVLDVNRMLGTVIIVLSFSVPFWIFFLRNRVVNWWALMPAWLLPTWALLILKFEGATNELIGTILLMIIALPYTIIYIKNRKKYEKKKIIIHSLSGSFFIMGFAVLYIVAWVLVPFSDVARNIAYGGASFDDYKRFPSRIAENAEPVFNFNQLLQGTSGLSVDYVSIVNNATVKSIYMQDFKSFEDFLTLSGTTSFLVIKDDALLYEWYGNGYSHDSIVTSWSVAKSFASALIGFAIDDGYVSSVNDPITEYIPELLLRDERFSEITIEHLLSMTSGIRFTEDNTPWGDDMKTYYASDMRKSALSVQIEQPPGEFFYHDYNHLLIGLIIERATGNAVTEYLEKKIWLPLGMEAPGAWQLDSEKSGFERLHIGINGRAIDFAKFGRLFLNNGNWNGEQLLSSKWVKESTQNAISTDRLSGYKYSWWINENSFSAQGAYGQYIFVFPEQNIIIVRFGIKNDLGDDWEEIFAEIAASAAVTFEK